MDAWLLSPRARNLAPQTQATCEMAARQFVAHLRESGEPLVTAALSRHHVESFVAHVAATRSAATANNRYRGLQQLFNWLLEEEEIERSPMERMKPPLIPEQPVPVVSEDDLRLLLKSCEGRDFVSRRDNAIVRLFIDTGLRRSELGNLGVGDLELSD